jgi:hypothetical protein
MQNPESRIQKPEEKKNGFGLIFWILGSGF